MNGTLTKIVAGLLLALAPAGSGLATVSHDTSETAVPAAGPTDGLSDELYDCEDDGDAIRDIDETVDRIPIVGDLVTIRPVCVPDAGDGGDVGPGDGPAELPEEHVPDPDHVRDQLLDTEALPALP